MIAVFKQRLNTLKLNPVRKINNSSSLLHKSQVTSSIPGGNLPVVILWWGLKDVNGHSVAREVSEAKHFWAHQGVLNE